MRKPRITLRVGFASSCFAGELGNEMDTVAMIMHVPSRRPHERHTVYSKMCSVSGPDTSSGAGDEFDASCSEVASVLIQSGFENDDAKCLATDQSIVIVKDGVTPKQRESLSASTASFQPASSIAGEKEQQLFRESNVEDCNAASHDTTNDERLDALGNTLSSSKADYESSRQCTSSLLHSTAGVTDTSSTIIGNAQDKRIRSSAKQAYLRRKEKVAMVKEKADALAKQRYTTEMRLREESREKKEMWRFRIHRRQTEAEWHMAISDKTAQAIIDTSLYRDAWRTGLAKANAVVDAKDRAFSSAFEDLQVRDSQRKEGAAEVADKLAEAKAAACSTVWDAARHGVPVGRLRELMEQKIARTRHNNPSDPFEELCRRVAGIVVESRHPYKKGIRQEFEACVPGATHFYIAFDPASNTTAGSGKVSLLRPNVRDPAVFMARGSYGGVRDELSTRLPGVNGEPPLRVDGSNVLITFTASYWRGVAPAGEDYGWRLVCFNTPSGGNASDDEAKDIVIEAQRAADRAEAVDAVNGLGETCLHVACFEGNVAGARYLLSLDADPNRAHSSGGLNTPLHEAVAGRSLLATRLLLKSSANILALNAHGDLPLHVACRVGQLDIVRRLLVHDVEWSTVGARNHAGKRPCDLARPSTALVVLLRMIEKEAAIAAGKRRSILQKIKYSWDKKNAINANGGFSRAHGGWTTSSSCSREIGDKQQKIGGGSIRTTGEKSRIGGATTVGPGVSNAWGVIPKAGGGSHQRWARLPRPLHDERGEEEGTGAVPLESASFTGSGTSYAASLTESDFDIPMDVVPLDDMTSKGPQKDTKGAGKGRHPMASKALLN